MEMNVAIESPRIELTTSSHVSTAVISLMFSDALMAFSLSRYLKSRPCDSSCSYSCASSHGKKQEGIFCFEVGWLVVLVMYYGYQT